jgi:hypothetical protein
VTYDRKYLRKDGPPGGLTLEEKRYLNKFWSTSVGKAYYHELKYDPHRELKLREFERIMKRNLKNEKALKKIDFQTRHRSPDKQYRRDLIDQHRKSRIDQYREHLITIDQKKYEVRPLDKRAKRPRESYLSQTEGKP